MQKKTMVVMMTVMAGALTLGGAAIVPVAGASDGGPGKGRERMREMARQIFDDADADKDGAVSSEEMKAALSARFADADGDKDGSVSRAELVSAIEKRAEGGRMARRAGAFADRMVVRVDLDGDGKVTLPEIENRAMKHFALADWNDDGKVMPDEIARMRGGRGDGHHGRGWWRKGE